jgi:hypothetical protein
MTYDTYLHHIHIHTHTYTHTHTYAMSTAGQPTLPPGCCTTCMPDLPYGVVLPPKSQAVELFGTAAGRRPN